MLDQIVGAIIRDDAWKQSSLPLSFSWLSVKQSQLQYKGAFLDSIKASEELVNKITSKCPSESHIFKELHQSLEPFNILSHTQKKMQEAFDKDKFAALIRNQTSTRGKAVACHGRGDAISRHDRIRDRIASACSAANLSPVIEKRNLIAENNSSPGGVYPPSRKSGQSAALDITVTSSLQPNIISHAAEKSGYGIEAAEDHK